MVKMKSYSYIFILTFLPCERLSSLYIRNLFLPTFAYVLVTPARYRSTQNNINNCLKLSTVSLKKKKNSVDWPSMLLFHVTLVEALG